MTSPFTIPLGARVKHIAAARDHDNWSGIVVERTHTERAGGGHRTDYLVRWITPEGDPSNGTTMHTAPELVVIDPLTAPAPMNTPHASSP